jgi:outer membrane receptor protein involved in Fe transport
MRQRIMKLSTFLAIVSLIALLFPIEALSQAAGKISGVVTGESGDPLPGCNISIEETGLGAATDLDGVFIVLNVPPGTYTVQAEMIGYRSEAIQNVKVIGNLTIKLNFQLNETVIEGEAVLVSDYRIPAVQKDLTYKVQALTAEEIRLVPISSAYDLILTQAGITRQVLTQPVSNLPVFGQYATIPSDGLHFRGGRENETTYYYDGVNVNDGLWGGFSLDNIGEYTLNSFEIYTGTFAPRFGEAMSGVVNMTTFGNVLSSYNFYAKGFTDNFGVDEWSNTTYSGEVSLRGPIPGLKNTSFSLGVRNYSSDGYIFGFVYPNYVDSEGKDFSGTPEEVPMQYTDNLTFLGKLLWQPRSNMTFSVGGFSSESQKGMYNHYFKYNPYGTPRVLLNDILGYAQFKHILGKKTFYNVTLAYYNRGFQAYVWDDSLSYLVIPQNGSAEFSFNGEDWVYFDSDFVRNELSVDFTSQVTTTHEIQVGATLDFLKTYLERRNPDGFAFLEKYDLRPRKYGGYIGDKMEFEKIGLIINAGLRFDYIDPNREYVVDISDVEGAVEKVDPRYYFTPRLGLSFPIAERAAFRFGYGHYYQYPDFYKIYQGLNESYARYPRPNPRLDTGAIAKGDLLEERTINYEAGVQTQISPAVSMDVVGFYRKTSNLIGITLVEDLSGVQMNVFDNINYATVKGIEISLKKRFSNNFSGFLNYTFSKTLVSSSFLFQRPQDLSRTFPADWDQPHILNMNLAFYFPGSQWGFSVFGSARSGYPYTANSFQPNAERGPWISQLDLMAYKDLSLLGIKQQIFLRVLNLANRRNIWWVYADSGKPGVDANPATSDDYTNNPAMWGPGRRVEIGLSVSK